MFSSVSKDPTRPLITSSYGKLQKKGKLKRKIPGGRSNLQVSVAFSLRLRT